MQAGHLQLMLDYIYKGEAVLPQAKLDTFLHLAKRFRLAGLAEDEDILERLQEAGQTQSATPSQVTLDPAPVEVDTICETRPILSRTRSLRQQP